MSYWTHIQGSIRVSVNGRTQAEVEYVLKTVLDHLPRITGSEGDADVHVIQCSGWDTCSCMHNEFGERSNNLKHSWWMDPGPGDLEVQHNYILVVHADLRDRFFAQTHWELMKWLCRLSKRVRVEEILLRLSAYDQTLLITDERPYESMYERKNNWTDYLYWERDPQSWWPLKLVDKYFNDEYVKEEMARRKQWEDENDT